MRAEVKQALRVCGCSLSGWEGKTPHFQWAFGMSGKQLSHHQHVSVILLSCFNPLLTYSTQYAELCFKSNLITKPARSGLTTSSTFPLSVSTTSASSCPSAPQMHSYCRAFVPILPASLRFPPLPPSTDPASSLKSQLKGHLFREASPSYLV